MGNAQGAEEGGHDYRNCNTHPVLVCEHGCVHRLHWVPPRSPSLKASQEAEARRGEAHTLPPAAGCTERQGNLLDDHFAHDSDSDQWGWYDEAVTSTSETESDMASPQSTHATTSFGKTNPPDYILEETLSTQALWHATAARRPRQPEKERKEMERLWAENIRQSKAVPPMPKPEEAAAISKCLPRAPPPRRQVLSKGISSYATSVTKSFECPACHQTSSLMLHIPKFQIVKLGTEVFAQYLVVVGIGNATVGVWRRFTDFQKLVCRISKDNNSMQQFRMSHFSWTVLIRRKRLFRCLDKEYLALKCFLLERFLHDVVFESRTPSLIRDFLGVW